MEDENIELTKNELTDIIKILGEVPTKYGVSQIIEFLLRKQSKEVASPEQ